MSPIYFFDKNISLENIKRKFSHLSLFGMQQVHGSKVKLLNLKRSTQSCKSHTLTVIKGVDGLIIKKRRVGLIIKHADCLPILISHPSGIIAAIHAGRKGTQKQIFFKVLSLLIEQFNITHDLSIWFGPRICQRCYQIDRQKDIHFDLIAENLRQLKLLFKPSAYVLTTHPSCTVCDQRFHSYRREGSALKMNYSLVIN